MNLKLNAVAPRAKLACRRLLFLFPALFLLIQFSATSVSAESGKIAYAAGNAIYKMNPDGTSVEQLTFNFGYDRDFSPVWSPDGLKIAFVRLTYEATGQPGGSDGPLGGSDTTNYNSTYSIYTIDYNGANPTQIKSGSAFINDLTWSPDGTKLAYVYGADTTFAGRLQSCSGNSYIYVVEATAGGTTRRVHGTAGAIDPSWSPDGTKIYFAVNNNPETYGIYSIDLSTDDITRITFDTVPPADPEISPDGSKIAYAVNYNEDQCLAGNMSTMGPSRIHIYRGSLIVHDIAQNSSLVAAVGGASSPSWHPDGSLILFVTTSGSEMEAPDLSTITPTGLNQTVIPNPEAGEISGSWSP